MSLHSYSRCWLHMIWATLNREKMLPPEAAAKASGSEILTSWKLGELFPKASDLPHPSPLPLGEGESPSALDKSGVFGLCSDGPKGSLSQRERAGVRERFRQLPLASKISPAGQDLCGYLTDYAASKDKYIANQEEHHRRKTFMEEYQSFVERYGLVWREEENG